MAAFVVKVIDGSKLKAAAIKPVTPEEKQQFIRSFFGLDKNDNSKQ